MVDVLERFGARREGMMTNALYYGDNLPGAAREHRG
jgi:hypothetical protein